jgi:peroxiredoxin
MQSRLPVRAMAALFAAIPFAAIAQNSTPAVDAPAPESAPAAETVKSELEALVKQVKAKLEAGQTTPAALADELKAFDQLSAKHASDKSDDAAMIPLMKAMLYAQVFEDTATAIPLFKQVIADFPGTRAASELPALIDRMEKDAIAAAITAVGKEFAPFKETATDGTVVDLAAYRGKVVLVDFWATWCGPCVGELPHVKEAYEKHHATGFEVIGVSLDQDGDKLAAFTKENAMPWPQIFDGQGWKSKLAQAYGIRSIPATFLLDRDGKIAAKGLRGEALSAKVAELLAAKP